jgi:glucose-1-phosphate adenylyltransferase
MMSDHKTIALILAGGSGTRLGRLTAWRAKPAVPFGGQFRTVDFPLSNCINSGIRQIALLTQYKSQSLIRHVQAGWSFLHRELGEFVDIWPAQQRCGERWYAGTVDAVRQNLDLVEAANPRYVLVLAGTQIYSMDYSVLLDEHIANRADLTIGCVDVPQAAERFEVVAVDQRSRVQAIVDRSIASVQTHDRKALRSVMGIYLFDARYLSECVAEDAATPDSMHDFGCNVLPAAVANGRVYAHDFRDPLTGKSGYWRDVSTLDCYWNAHMDLLGEPPKFDILDESWPIWTHHPPTGPARIRGSVQINAALLGRGCEIAGEVYDSVLGPSCRVGQHSRIASSVLLPHVRVGSGCSLDRVVIDSYCEIPDNTVIGSDSPVDAQHEVSPQGIVLVTRPRNAARRHHPRTPRKVA